MEAADLVVLLHQFLDNLIAIPIDFQSELQFASHLFEHVFDRRIDSLQNFPDIVVGTKNGTEAHGNNSVILHHRLDYVLVSQGVFSRGVEDGHSGFTHYGGNVQIIYGVDLLTGAADADTAEVHGPLGANNSVHVSPALSRGR